MILLRHPPRTNRPPRYSCVRTSQLQWAVWLRPRQQIYWIWCVLKSIQHYVRNGLNSSPASFKGRLPIPVLDLMPPVVLPIVSVNCVFTVHALSLARATAHAQHCKFQFHSVHRRKSAFFWRVRKTAKSDYWLRRVCPYAWNNTAPTERIFMKFDIWVFLKNPPRAFKSH
jgi:hypothetical protein